MAEWINPVFDRTAEDVDSLDRTSAESQKGALSAADLNRIEGNFAFVLGMLRRNHIFVSHVFRNIEETTRNADGTSTTATYTDWHEHNIPWFSEINRIRRNHNALAKEYLTGHGLTIYPEDDYLDYAEVNDWERFVFIAREIFEKMEQDYRYCGTEDSGGGRLL